MMEGSFVDGVCAGRRLVPGAHPSGEDCPAVGSLIVFQVVARQIDERRSGVAFIGKYESRDNQ
jgi:hypothetical protein